MYRAKIFFKGNPVDSPLDVANIFKITVDQHEVQPKDVKFEDVQTIVLHSSGKHFGNQTTHSTMVLKCSDLLAIEFVEDTND